MPVCPLYGPSVYSAEAWMKASTLVSLSQHMWWNTCDTQQIRCHALGRVEWDWFATFSNAFLLSAVALRKALEILVTDVSFINCCGRTTSWKNGLLLFFLLLGKPSTLTILAKWTQGVRFIYTTIALSIMTFPKLILELCWQMCWGIYSMYVPLRRIVRLVMMEHKNQPIGCLKTEIKKCLYSSYLLVHNWLK